MALRFGDHDGPPVEWATQPGARGVASHVSHAPPLAFEWDFEDVAGSSASGWTVVAGDAAAPTVCGRIDPTRLVGSRDIDEIIGGDYWRRSYWPGQSGECMVDTAARRVTYVSPAFTLGPENEHISFLVGGGGPGGSVRLEVTGLGEAFRESGPGTVGMVRVDYVVPASAFGHQARVVIEGLGGNGILVDDILGSTGALGWHQDNAPLWGYADLHNHVFNHLTSGGQLLVGRVTEHPLPGDTAAGLRAGDGIAHALEDCPAHHGVLPGNLSMSASPDPFAHYRDGYPTFDGWPKADVLVHEQVYVDWLKRAWQGGLRIVQLDVGNTDFAAKEYATANFWLGHRHPFPRTDDDDAIDRTLDAVRDFVAGEGGGWAEVATSSRRAREIVAQGKLALVLGIEVDSIGENYDTCGKEPHLWARIGPPTCHMLPGTPTELSRKIHDLLARVYLRGVSHIIPVHLVDNAYGMPAVYGRAFDIESQWANGYALLFDNGWDLGVRFKLSDDLVNGDSFTTFLMAWVGDVRPAFDPHRLVGGVPADGRFSHIARGGLKPPGSWR